MEEYAWLGLGDVSRLATANPLLERTLEDIERPDLALLRLIRDPRNFAFTCRHVLGVKLAPFQIPVLWQLWHKPRPMMVAVRGFGKSWMLGVYAVLRALIDQGSKVVIVGSGFRQAKGVFEYVEKVWNRAPVLRDLAGPESRIKKEADRWILNLGDSSITAIPIGDGRTIRGLRASHLLCDEFASQNPETFETVIASFAAVSLDPVERMERFARHEWRKSQGLVPKGSSLEEECNQTVLAGTAAYAFNHFYKYWKRYRDIILSRGDRRKLEEIFTGRVPEGLDWRHYCIVRVPYDLVPPGYMDENTIAGLLATLHEGARQNELGATFSVDSNGFYKRSVIERCVVGKPEAPVILGGREVTFDVALRGDPARRYLMGVDPAAQVDNFSIVVLELWPDHRRLVYCWTTSKEAFRNQRREGLTAEADFYRYAARKIRLLHALFPCELIAVDSQGGGLGIFEALGDTAFLAPGERPIYPTVSDDEPRETDDLPGEHIIKVINFASSEWVTEANTGLKKDFEEMALLLPRYNTAMLAAALEDDRLGGRTVEVEGRTMRLGETLEDLMQEVEELKDELATIVYSQTGVSGRDKWDTPEQKLPGMKKGRMRKDRYSALLMANAEARRLVRRIEQPQHESFGAWAKGRRPDRPASDRPRGPGWYLDQQASHAYGQVPRRR